MPCRNVVQARQVKTNVHLLAVLIWRRPCGPPAVMPAVLHGEKKFFEDSTSRRDGAEASGAGLLPRNIRQAFDADPAPHPANARSGRQRTCSSPMRADSPSRLCASVNPVGARGHAPRIDEGPVDRCGGRRVGRRCRGWLAAGNERLVERGQCDESDREEGAWRSRCRRGPGRRQTRAGRRLQLALEYRARRRLRCLRRPTAGRGRGNDGAGRRGRRSGNRNRSWYRGAVHRIEVGDDVRPGLPQFGALVCPLVSWLPGLSIT